MQSFLFGLLRPKSEIHLTQHFPQTVTTLLANKSAPATLPRQSSWLSGGLQVRSFSLHLTRDDNHAE